MVGEIWRLICDEQGEVLGFPELMYVVTVNHLECGSGQGDFAVSAVSLTQAPSIASYQRQATRRKRKATRSCPLRLRYCDLVRRTVE